MAHLAPFLSKISGKFMVKVPNLSFSGGGWVSSQVLVNCQLFFTGSPFLNTELFQVSLAIANTRRTRSGVGVACFEQDYEV